MKSNLLGVDHLDYEKKLSEVEETTYKDLELDVIVQAMAQEDEYLEDIIKKILFQPSLTQEDMEKRQMAVKDALKNKETVEFLYNCASMAVKEEREGIWGRFDGYPSFAVSHAKNNIEMFIKKLDSILEKRPAHVNSIAFNSFFDRLEDALSKEKEKEMLSLVRSLEFVNGEEIVCSMMSDGETRPDHVLWSEDASMGKVAFFLKKTLKDRHDFFRIDEQDENTFRNMSNFKHQSEYELAQIMASLSDSFLELFKSIRAEAGFLTGVVRLYEKTGSEKICFPDAGDSSVFQEIKYYPYLLENKKNVPNSVKFENPVLLITGANQGGKTTFLKAIGQIYMLAQNGLFVPAEKVQIPLVHKVITHFRKEEDDTLHKGKLAEELERFDGIINEVDPGTLLLFNESFASTNEEEGSRISEEITKALEDSGVRVYFVTHQYTFAMKMYREGRGEFLRPQRGEDGKRSYKIEKGRPEPTSYGMDIYEKIFENDG